MRSIPPLLFLCALALSAFSVSYGVGLRKRLADANADAGGTTDADASGAKRPRGGIKQRLNAARAAEPADTPGASSSQLPLTNALKLDWAAGRLTSPQVQRYALAAAEQGATGLDPLARAGNYGNNPQNLLRALMGVFEHPRGAPPFDWAEIPTKLGLRTPHPFFLPHSFFQHFYNGARDKWNSAIRGPRPASNEFWGNIQGSHYSRMHPRRHQQDWRRTVPLGLHGDAGAFSHQDSLMTISFNSLIGSGVTIQKRFVITIIRKSDMLPGTMDAIFRIIAHSFNALLLGETPGETADGHPLAGGGVPLADGWCGALCQIRGDWQFYAETFHVPTWNGAERMCWLCKASNTNRHLSWTDCRSCAGWRDTLWTHETYMDHLRLVGLPIPILLMSVIGLRLECLMIDVLHAVDLGLAAHIIGNIMWIFAVVRTCLGGANMAEKIKRLQTHMDAWYKRTQCSHRLQGKLSVERLRATSSAWPKLKGKGAAIRKLASYALQLAQEFANDSDNDQSILEMIRLLVRFYQIIDSESMYLTAAVRRELPEIGQKLAELYSKLAKEAFENGSRLWKATPKLHLWEHLLEHQTLEFFNPRFFWCYSDEDLVGQLVDIGATCHPRTLAVTALFKWLHLLFDAAE